jgi:hypothetical protein
MIASASHNAILAADYDDRKAIIKSKLQSFIILHDVNDVNEITLNKKPTCLE